MATEEKKDLKAVVKSKFISTTLSGKEIAALFSISEKTISKWRKEGNWDALREAYNTQPELLIQTYMRAQAAINEKVAEDKRAHTPAELDSLSKLSRMVKDLRNTHTPQVCMEVMNSFSNYLAQVDLDMAQAVTPHTLNYVQNKFKEARG